MNLLIIQPDARIGGHLLPVENVGDAGEQVYLQGQVLSIVPLYLKLEHVEVEGELVDTIFLGFASRLFKDIFMISQLEPNYCSLKGLVINQKLCQPDLPLL